MIILTRNIEKTIYLLIILLLPSISFAAVNINDVYVPTIEALGKASGLKYNSENKLVFFNEKPYAITAELLLVDGSIIKYTLPPRSAGPIESAVAVFDNPLSTIESIISDDFGQSEILLKNINEEEIKSITYIGGRSDAQKLNVIFLVTTAIQNSAKILKLNGNDKTIFDIVGQKVIVKMTEESFINGLITEMSSGCGFFNTCASYLSGEIQRILLESTEEVASNIAYREILAGIGVDPSYAADLLLKKIPAIKALEYLAVAEGFSDWIGLLSGTMAFSSEPTVLRVQAVELTEDKLITPNPILPEPTNPLPLIPTPPEVIIPPTNPLPTWTGSASMVGRAADFSPHYRPHGLRANGKAPSNNTVIFEPEYGQISAPIIGTQNGRNIGHSYQHLIWGNWSGGNRTFVRGIDGVTVNNLSGFFVYGEAIPQGARSGTATYTGQVLGDLVRGADQSIGRGVVHGTLGITAYLDTGNLGGWLALNKDGATSPWVVADIQGASIVSSAGGTAFGGNLVGSNGENGSLSGNFFGANGTELGGSYWLNGVDDTSGIFLGYETPTMPVRPPNPVVVVPRYRGFIAGRVSSGGLFTTSANTLNNGRTALTAGLNTIESSDHTLGVSVQADFGAYSHTAWGRWNGADSYGLAIGYSTSTLEKGHWVMGRVTTPAELSARIARNDARSGGARYIGHLAGTSFNGDTIGGTVTLNANFVNSSISGNLSFTHNSSAWVSGALNSSNIVTNSEGIGYNGDISLNGGGAGHMSGILYGPNAEETGGEWAIWNVPDSIGGADGVFRAKE